MSRLEFDEGNARCKTCGGTAGNHRPSILDPEGKGNPAHALPPGSFTPEPAEPPEPVPGAVPPPADLEAAGAYAAIPADVVLALEALGDPPERYIAVETPAYKEYRRAAGLLICRAVGEHPRNQLPCAACLSHVDRVVAASAAPATPSGSAPPPGRITMGGSARPEGEPHDHPHDQPER